ncbi:fumarate hydratase C-terminal domain-containing protein [Klebsiella variicola subsp. variicola]|nr:fumarate hydratase C-terminal domain-containing protein [Klebsiella variicola subsp. variicola]
MAYPELGMEAIWKIEVEDFSAFILVDDKGNDFFQQIQNKQVCRLSTARLTLTSDADIRPSAVWATAFYAHAAPA